jgi:hypothetical protein
MSELSSEFGLQTAPLRGKSQTLMRESNSLRQLEISVVDKGVFQELELILRGEGSTRFHPNRRASTDHRPGPNMARAQAVVPSKTVTHRSPAIVMICQVSSNATKTPTMGVHRPGMRRSPDPARNAEINVVVRGGFLHSVEFARKSSEAPRTTRMRSKPVPGQPPAKVEYRRRKTHLSKLHQFPALQTGIETPKRVAIGHSLEFCWPRGSSRRN